MNKLLIVLTIMSIGLTAYAQDPIVDYINVKEICDSLKNNSPVAIVKDHSTCRVNEETPFKINHIHELLVNRVDTETEQVEELQTHISENQLQKICAELSGDTFKADEARSISMEISVAGEIKKQKRKWRIAFTFGPFLSFHKKMKMRLQNDDTDVVIDGLEPVQRTGLHHYAVWSSNTEIGKFIDEPQNDITVEIANGKTFYGLRYSHPKTLFQDRHDNPQINHSIDIAGTIGGKQVNEQDVDLKTYIHTLSTSHGNTNINAFGGKILTLAGSQGKNNLELRLGAGAGVSFANGVSKYWAYDEDNNKKLKIKEHDGMKVYGFNLTGESTLRYNFLQGKMNASVNARGVYTRINGPMGDFGATGNLYSGQVGVSIGYSPNLLKTKKEKAERKIAQIKKRDEKYKKLEEKLENFE